MIRARMLLVSAILIGAFGCSGDQPNVDANTDLEKAGAVAGDKGATDKAPPKGMSSDSLTVPTQGN